MKISSINSLYAKNETHHSTYHRMPSVKGFSPSFLVRSHYFYKIHKGCCKLVEFTAASINDTIIFNVFLLFIPPKKL